MLFTLLKDLPPGHHLILPCMPHYCSMSRSSSPSSSLADPCDEKDSSNEYLLDFDKDRLDDEEDYLKTSIRRSRSPVFWFALHITLISLFAITFISGGLQLKQTSSTSLDFQSTYRMYAPNIYGIAAQMIQHIWTRLYTRSRDRFKENSIIGPYSRANQDRTLTMPGTLSLIAKSSVSMKTCFRF